MPGAVPASDRDNPTGIDGAVFEDIKASAARDRYAFFKGFYANFYNTDELLDSRVSQEVVDASWAVAASASPYASVEAISNWTTDFRDDVATIAAIATCPFSSATELRTEHFPSTSPHARSMRCFLLRRTSRWTAPRTACSGPTPTR